MSQSFVAYEPVNTLKPVAADVWIVDGPEIRMRYFGVRLPFPTRMTLVRLPGGGLWLHSPIEPDDALVERIAALGPVEYLVAPNTLHYWSIPAWHARFPQAQIHAAPGLVEQAKRELPPTRTLSADADVAWGGVIDQVLVTGSLLTEVDFFHRPSRTLILTDLIENFEPARVRSPVLRFVMRVFGAADPDGKAPYDMQWSFRRNRDLLRRAALQMIDWAPERVILAHGRWYPQDGTAELRRAFRWMV